MRRWRFYVGLLVGGVLMLFALQNLQVTQVRLLFWYADLPLVGIVFASAAIGAVWASLWIAVIRWNKGRQEAAVPAEPAKPDSAADPAPPHAGPGDP